MTETTTTTTIETPAATLAPTHANGKPVGVKKDKKAGLKAQKAAAKTKREAKAAAATTPTTDKPAKGTPVSATKEVKPATTPKADDHRPLKADGKPIAKGWVAILLHLAKKDATSRNASVSKGDGVKAGLGHGGWYELADCGYAGVEGLGLLARADAEEGKTTYLTERFYLTASGKAACKKMLGK